MKIRTQLVLCTTILLLVVIIFGSLIVVTSRQISQIESQENLARQIQLDTYNLEQLSTDYLLNREERQVVQWNTQYAILSADLDKLETGGPDEEALIGSIQSDKVHLQEIFAEISSEYGTRRGGNASPEGASIAASWSRLAVGSQGLISGSSQLLALIHEKADRLEEMQIFLMAALLGSVLGILFANYFLVYRRLSDSIADLQKGTDVISSGNLDYRIPEKGSDEFRDLAASFNAMAASRSLAEENLLRKNTDLESAYEEITSTEEELRENYEELTRVERELRTSEQRLRSFYDSGLVGVIYWTTDGGIQDANDAFLKMTGYSRDELHNGRIDWAAMTPPEYRDRDEESLIELKNNGRNRVPFEKEYIRKDGSRVPVLVAGAMLDERFTKGVAFVLDITNLRESQAKLDAALSSMTDAVFISDVAGNFIEFNEAFATFHKFPDKASCKKTLAEYPDFLDVYLPDGTLAPLDMWAVPRALRGESVTNAEYSLRRRDTGETWVGSYSFAPIRDSSGTIVGSVVVGRDITEWKNAQDALKRSESRYRELFNNIPVGISRSTPGPGGKILSANPAVLRIFEAGSLEELLSTPPESLYADPISRQRFVEEMVRNNSVTGMEIRYRSCKGKPFWGRVSSKKGTASDGSVYFDNTVEDITERKIAEEALRVSEERFRQLFEKNYTVMLIIDPTDGRILDANPAAIGFYGYPLDVFRTMKVQDINTLPKDDISGILSRVRDGKLHHFDVPHRMADGTIRAVEIFATPVITEGRPRLIAIVHDITDRKKMETEIRSLNQNLELKVMERTEELNRSLQEKEVLLREIHHRVKNNLQIVASLFSLQARFIKDESVLNAIKEGKNRIHAMALVHEKLYRSGDLEHINLTEYLTFLVKNLFQFYNINTGRICFSIDVKDLPISIQEAIPIGLVVNELVSNSLKYAFPKGKTGEITITGHRENGTIVLRIRDTGTGIPPDFDWRNAQSLGLRLVVILTEQLAGTIDLDRSIGTTFTIRIPVKPHS